jgi:glycosyltransferase involved in cell wall biosynthesis
MALGLPVISTEVGGIPYLIRNQENGLLVPDGDAQAFIHSINHLLHDPKLAYRLSESGRATAKGFAWGHVKLQWHKLLS